MNVTRIREEIERVGFNHRKLAKRIGVHPNTLSRFLTGKTKSMDSEKLMNLLKILNLNAKSLVKDAA